MSEKQQNNWDRVARWVGRERAAHDKEENQEDAMISGNEAFVQEELKEQAAGKVLHEAGEESHPDLSAEPAASSALHQEIDQLRGERDQLMDRLARLQAEFDNARKREQKERADAREYTVGNTVEPFLGVMDNFQLALKADGTAEQLRAGVELILKQMEEALKGLQVQVVETVGTQFDPRVHEALGSIETSEFPDHQVLEEIRRGYKIREKLLRPALVRIASNSAQVPA